MGDDRNGASARVITTMIDLGNTPHRYSFDETLDKFLPDYYIKHFLENSLNATSQDTDNNDVKKICYKGYSDCQLPNWENIGI